MTGVDSLGHTGLAYQWTDNGAGGTFSPSATAQNPTYTAAVNKTGSARTVTLTATANRRMAVSVGERQRDGEADRELVAAHA